ncbi:hypothetical protein I4F81_002415 [Pyropia yezoensis]|uniref:Uncharacterized protein n=1 Tax=Pyropia yezoensis TaxID=2788 RepID=A0ACC3BQY9_PYRYE|nr:hypothetical protein I4F81_002415 [Neopyropia yezoensis]
MRAVEAGAGERLPAGRAARKAAAAVVTLGTGNSLGPEGPAVELGAAVAWGVIDAWAAAARWFDGARGGGVGGGGGRASAAVGAGVRRSQLLVGAGAAAGVSAGFDAPMAGVFFALELVLAGRVGAAEGGGGILGGGEGDVSVLLLAAAVAGVVVNVGLGGSVLFDPPPYELRAPLVELPAYLGLGVLGGGVSLAWRRLLRAVEAVAAGAVDGRGLTLPGGGTVPAALLPVFGGGVCGLLAVAYPQVLFAGYDTFDALLHDVQFPLPLLATLLVLKPLATAIALSCGLVGGTLAPSLFVGAALGATYQKLLALALGGALAAFPALGGLVSPAGAAGAAAAAAAGVGGSAVGLIAPAPAYALVGMAAVLAGVFRAPLTASILLFEMTRDFRIVLPLLAAVGIASWMVDAASTPRAGGGGGGGGALAVPPVPPRARAGGDDGVTEGASGAAAAAAAVAGPSTAATTHGGDPGAAAGAAAASDGRGGDVLLPASLTLAALSPPVAGGATPAAPPPASFLFQVASEWERLLSSLPVAAVMVAPSVVVTDVEPLADVVNALLSARAPVAMVVRAGTGWMPAPAVVAPTPVDVGGGGGGGGPANGDGAPVAAAVPSYGELLGVLTVGDVTRALAAAGRAADADAHSSGGGGGGDWVAPTAAAAAPALAAATAGGAVVTVRPGDSAAEAADAMRAAAVGQLPVVVPVVVSAGPVMTWPATGSDGDDSGGGGGGGGGGSGGGTGGGAAASPVRVALHLQGVVYAVDVRRGGRLEALRATAARAAAATAAAEAAAMQAAAVDGGGGEAGEGAGRG